MKEIVRVGLRFSFSHCESERRIKKYFLWRQEHISNSDIIVCYSFEIIRQMITITIILVVANADIDKQVHLSRKIQECDSHNAISLRMTTTSTKNRRGRVLLCVLEQRALQQQIYSCRQLPTHRKQRRGNLPKNNPWLEIGSRQKISSAAQIKAIDVPLIEDEDQGNRIV